MRRLSLALSLSLLACTAHAGGWLRGGSPPPSEAPPSEKPQAGLTMTTLEVGGEGQPDFAPYDAVAFRPDGLRRASRTRDHQGVEIAETRLSLQAKTMGRRDAVVTALRYDPTGTALAAGYADGVVVLLDPETGRERSRWEAGDGGPVEDLAVLPKGAWVASLERGRGTVRLHYPGAAAVRMGNVRGVRCLVASSGGDLFMAGEETILRVAIGSTDGRVERLETEGAITGMAISSDGKRLAAGAAEGPVWIYARDEGDFALERTWAGGAAWTSQAIAFSADGAVLVASQADDPMRLVAVRVADLRPHGRYFVMLQAPRAVAFRPDGGIVYAGGLSSGVAGTLDGNDDAENRRR